MLISAEQFGPQLTCAGAVGALQAIARENEFELTIVIFIRSQLDYINSRYGYSLKRFYQSKTFDEYVQDVLDGERIIKGKAVETDKRRSDIFDFWNYFYALLNKRQGGLDVRFIPFRQTHPDPFIQFLHSLDLDPSLRWT